MILDIHANPREAIDYHVFDVEAGVEIPCVWADDELGIAMTYESEPAISARHPTMNVRKYVVLPGDEKPRMKAIVRPIRIERRSDVD